MTPCSDERPGDRERETSAYEAMGLLCEIIKLANDGRAALTVDDAPLMTRIVAWWEEHQRLDALDDAPPA